MPENEEQTKEFDIEKEIVSQEEIDNLVEIEKHGEKMEELMKNELFLELIMLGYVKNYTENLAEAMERTNPSMDAAIFAQVKGRSMLTRFIKDAIEEGEQARTELKNIASLEE